jgi:hypothetical protein
MTSKCYGVKVGVTAEALTSALPILGIFGTVRPPVLEGNGVYSVLVDMPPSEAAEPFAYDPSGLPPLGMVDARRDGLSVSFTLRKLD